MDSVFSHFERTEKKVGARTLSRWYSSELIHKSLVDRWTRCAWSQCDMLDGRTRTRH